MLDMPLKQTKPKQTKPLRVNKYIVKQTKQTNR